MVRRVRLAANRVCGDVTGHGGGDAARASPLGLIVAGLRRILVTAQADAHCRHWRQWVYPAYRRSTESSLNANRPCPPWKTRNSVKGKGLLNSKARVCTCEPERIGSLARTVSRLKTSSYAGKWVMTV